MNTNFTNNINTHKARVCKETAERNGWELEYRCTAELGMDDSVVIDYAWEYCCRFMMQIKDFFHLTRSIKRSVNWDDVWDYAEKAAQEHRATKSSTTWSELSEYYIIS